MTTSRTEDDAMLLLEGFYDLSGGKPNKPVPVGDQESTEAEAAAPKAGMDPGSISCEIAVRYLVDQGYIKAADEPDQGPDTYTLTVPGIDKIKELRGTG
ncbi:MAG: hypothetical protein M3N10_07725 [Actinomycetota bacterium]|nr:hypothetical protein [Actinomycetota bacterium]HZY64899.1 hypothetical protein [Rubrobacteraceae bacterium]